MGRENRAAFLCGGACLLCGLFLWGVVSLWAWALRGVDSSVGCKRKAPAFCRVCVALGVVGLPRLLVLSMRYLCIGCVLALYALQVL